MEIELIVRHKSGKTFVRKMHSYRQLLEFVQAQELKRIEWTKSQENSSNNVEQSSV